MKWKKWFDCFPVFQMKKWLGLVLILFVFTVFVVCSMPLNLFFFPRSSQVDLMLPYPHAESYLRVRAAEASEATRWIHLVLSEMMMVMMVMRQASPLSTNTSPSSSPSPWPRDEQEEEEEEDKEEGSSSALSVWKYMAPVLSRSDCFPKAKQAMKEAENYWLEFIEEQRQQRWQKKKWHEHATDNDAARAMEMKKCPSSVSSVLKQSGTSSHGRMKDLQIPCGLVVDSSITIVAIAGRDGGFAIDLLGDGGDMDHHHHHHHQEEEEEEEAPIILHFNVTLQGHHSQHHHGPMIIQNTWTSDHGWGADEQRCPPSPSPSSPSPHHPSTNLRKVDNMEPCNGKIVGHVRELGDNVATIVGTRKMPSTSSNTKDWFPFVEGSPFAATLWVGWEGFHMTINGKHITSYAYRQNLKPSLVTRVRLKGSVTPTSILSTGLPTSEDISQVGLELLKAPRFLHKNTNELFIGVFSTANNFDRRMAVRRSWMQYEVVRSGKVTVRFFVGQHSNKQVNDEIWREALRYGDIQLMPFVDYYDLIALKTIAICIFGVEKMRPNYIMKTDDDTFVRVDEVLRGLRNRRKRKGLLYGLIEYNSQPRRDPTDKWYISTDEWPDSSYPPWAMGPGYIISADIARFIVDSHYSQRLKLFKLEDVSMGIWVQAYKNQINEVDYVSDNKFNNLGCSEGYITAHYQKPKQMACLWNKLQEQLGPTCCNER